MSARYTGGLVYNAPGGWSGQFSGSNYLSVAGNAAFNVGSGEFCVEAWVYPISTSTDPVIFTVSADARATNNDYGIYVGLGSAQIVYCGIYYGVLSTDFATTATVQLNTWNHVAMVRSSGVLYIYINGVQSGSIASAVTANFSSSWTPKIGYFQSTSTRYMNGYISNLRFVVGSPVYTSNFTPPTGALLPITNTKLLTCRYPTFVDGSTLVSTITNTGSVAVNTLNPFPTSQLPNPALGGAGNGVYTMSQYAALKAANLWPAFDPFYRNVTLNLHGNGTNAAQNNTFLDSSTNNITITRVGNTTQGTFTPYGSNWSYNSGTSSTDYLTTASNAAFAFGTGDFTMEAFVFATASQTDNWIIGLANNCWFRVGSGGALEFYNAVTSTSTLASSAMSINTWNHVAVVRSGTALTIYQNGVSVGTATVSTNFSSSVACTIGNQVGFDRRWNGYISNARVVKGTAVYTAAFTPSTTPLTAITNTSLLTCQSNRFVDNSASPFTLTVSGSPSVQRFSPFSPTTAYDASVIGGSSYMDGTGDYLYFPNNAALSFGTGDFCVEAYVYKQRAANESIIDSRATNNASPWALYIDGSNFPYFYDGTSYTSTIAITLNAWVHVAVARSSGTLKIFVNGVQGYSGTVTTNLDRSSGNEVIGATVVTFANTWLGYMSSFRIVKGSAVYTTAFTPPTAPLTAITNTSLLLNYTNAGILDNAMMNNLETVGNAQVSTSVKKYGTGSLAFDGSGDWLIGAGSPNPIRAFNTGDFTVEMWVYPTQLNSATDYNIIDFRSGGTTTGFRIGINSSTVPFVAAVGGILNGSFTFSINNWYHFAVTRSSGTLTIWINGVSAGSNTTTTNFTDSYLTIGSSAAGNIGPYFGYIDDLRITKGVARYTGNFTPPTSQVQDQ